MWMVALALILIGMLAIFATGIWYLVVAFQQDVVWGLCCMLVPFASIVFLFKFWQKAKKPFIGQLVACLPLLTGWLILQSIVPK